MAELGVRLREARVSRGWSLVQLGEGTGLSPSFISLVENGKSDISMGRLARILEVMDITFADLTDPAAQEAITARSATPFTALRAGDRPRISPVSGIEISLLPRSEGRNILRLLMTYAPHAALDVFEQRERQRRGECFLLILRGTLVLELVSGDRITLRTGDSIVSRLEDAARCSNPIRHQAEVYVELPVR
jgi:transcriptional regulator with XRE-family HTH domain